MVITVQILCHKLQQSRSFTLVSFQSALRGLPGQFSVGANIAVQPLDMRVGTEAALARVVQVFGQAHPHHAYLFANRRANRMKVLVHDGIGVWLAARRLNIGKFTWSSDAANTLPLSRTQFDALVLGLPWQRLGDAGIIRVI